MMVDVVGFLLECLFWGLILGLGLLVYGRLKQVIGYLRRLEMIGMDILRIQFKLLQLKLEEERVQVIEMEKVKP